MHIQNNKELLAISSAVKSVEYCNALFLLERKYSGLNENGDLIAEPMTSEEQYYVRQTQSKPVLDTFYV